MPEAESALAHWSDFYVVAGTAAATLTGLMFVVISLIKDTGNRTNDGIATFSTPTVVHFCVALFVSMAILIPYHEVWLAAGTSGVAGAYGVFHVIGVAVRARRLATYKPDLEDWMLYWILPLASYLLMLGGAIAMPHAEKAGLLAVAASVIFLTFIGIRNAWDVVTFLVSSDTPDPITPVDPSKEGPAPPPDKSPAQ